MGDSPVVYRERLLAIVKEARSSRSSCKRGSTSPAAEYLSLPSPLAGRRGIKYPVDTMLEQDIRWKQRFENFKRTRANLELALSLPQRDIVQRAGLVHFFELAFELSWKVLKDYLEAQGFEELASPHQTLRTAFETGLIQEGAAWLKGLEARNLTTHLYNEEKAVEIERLIQTTYAPLFRDLEQVLIDKSSNE